MSKVAESGGLDEFYAKAWDQLRRPVWVFDPVARRGVYANAPALLLWEARSRAELLGRDFSNLSPAVVARTDRLAKATAGGKAITESWTFYPRGHAVTVEAVISSIGLGGGGRGLLFEADSIEIDEGELRAVEALRHTSSLISLFDVRGRVLFTNPAAFAAYGEGDFGYRFRRAEQAREALARVLRGEVLSSLMEVETRQGYRSHHLDARQVTDPVSGRASILLSERDVSAQVAAERALVVARERIDAADARDAARRVEQRLREASEARLRAVFETSYQFQALLTLRGAIIDANGASLRAIGAALPAVKGLPFWEAPWFAATPEVAERVRRQVAAAALGEAVRSEVELELPLSGSRCYDLTLRAIRDDGEHVSAIVAEAVELSPLHGL